MSERGGAVPNELKQIANRIGDSGGTPLAVADGARVLGIIHLKDIVKAGIAERFERFRAMGIRTVMITGDNPRTAAAIAKEAGVDDFLAEATPETKMRLIKDEQAKGKLVAMTGDGTNDAPALAQADVGVAMNSGTQAAKEAGNMVDLDSNPTKLLEVVEVGKQLLMTRGTLTTFSIANDVAKYFAILPAMFMGVFPEIAPLNVMRLASPSSRDPVGGDLQRAHHHPAHPARAARGEVPAARRRGDPAPLAADLRRGRHRRAVRRHQAHRPGPGRPSHRLKRNHHMRREIMIALRATLVTLVLTGLVYPLAMTGVAQALFRDKAERQPGSRREGRGGRLRAHRPGVREPRLPPGAPVGGRQRLRRDRVVRVEPRARRRRSCATAWRPTSSACARRTPTRRCPIPAELVTASASGLDPDLSPQAALWQVPRIARARQVAPERIAQVIESRVEGRDLGFLGEPRVNVLAVNLALDQQFGKPAPLAARDAPDRGGRSSAGAGAPANCAAPDRRRPAICTITGAGSDRWRRAVRRQSSSHSGNSSASAACARQNSRTERPGAGSQIVFRFSIVRW